MRWRKQLNSRPTFGLSTMQLTAIPFTGIPAPTREASLSSTLLGALLGALLVLSVPAMGEPGSPHAEGTAAALSSDRDSAQQIPDQEPLTEAQPEAGGNPEEAAGSAEIEPAISAGGHAAEAQAVTDAVAEPGTALSTMTTMAEVLDEVADPLTQIERQIETQEYEFAEQWLERYIREIEATNNRYDPALVRPITLLGDAQMAQGDYARALQNYERAVHLSRVNDGLNTPQQVTIVYREADAYRRLGDYELANAREEYAYHVLRRSYEPTDEALLPGMYHLAHWYEATGNPFAARAVYEDAERIIVANGKDDTPMAIPVFQGIARTYRMERFPPFYAAAIATTEAATSTFDQPIAVNNFPAGERALQRIVQIRQEQQDAEPLALAESVLDLADWYTLFDKTSRAESLYQHAYGLMAQIPGFDTVGYFAEPRLLYFPSPGNPTPPPLNERGEAHPGYVEVAYRVTNTGYVRDMETVASEPEGMMDFRVRKSLRLARFRPMLIEGVPIDRELHTYRHEFTYYPKMDASEAMTQKAAGSS